MNAKLRDIITSPMRTLISIHAGFDYCETVDDIREVIRKIPPKFGEFEILTVSEREGYLSICNYFNRDGEPQAKIVSYDFYTIKGDCYDYRR